MNFCTVFVFVTSIGTMIYLLPVESLCRHLKFTDPVPGFALEGHVIKNLSIGISASCKNLCTLEDHCVSFNLGPPGNLNRMVCELSDSDVTKHPGDLKPREGFVIRCTENACFSNPCPNNATCLTGFTEKKYLCQCQAGYTGEQCEKGNWKKINDNTVCFKGSANNYGEFYIKESGHVYTFKLVHRNGSIRCNDIDPPSYWGCVHPYFEERRLSTVITYPNKTALLLADDLRYEPEEGYGLKSFTYQIPGISVNSTELVFNKLPAPLSVSVGQEFQIWYAQDLIDRSEENNSGQTCADVYAWYA